MTAHTPSTPEEEWSAIDATVRAIDEQHIGAMTDAEVSALLVEEGFDLDAVHRTRDAFLAALRGGLDATARGAETRIEDMTDVEAKALLETRGFDVPAVHETRDAFLAGLRGELDAMGEQAASAPSNVIPFPRKSTARARWTVALLGAAAAATLAMTQAAMVAIYDPWHAASVRGRPPVVLADTRAAEVNRLAGAALDAASWNDWDGCLARLDEAEPLRSAPQLDLDELRTTCTEAKLDLLVGEAQAAAAAHNWRECLVYLSEARTLKPDAAAIPFALFSTCNDAAIKMDNSKAP